MPDPMNICNCDSDFVGGYIVLLIIETEYAVTNAEEQSQYDHVHLEDEFGKIM